MHSQSVVEEPRKRASRESSVVRTMFTNTRANSSTNSCIEISRSTRWTLDRARVSHPTEKDDKKKASIDPMSHLEDVDSVAIEDVRRLNVNIDTYTITHSGLTYSITEEKQNAPSRLHAGLTFAGLLSRMSIVLLLRISSRSRSMLMPLPSRLTTGAHDVLSELGAKPSVHFSITQTPAAHDAEALSTCGSAVQSTPLAAAAPNGVRVAHPPPVSIPCRQRRLTRRSGDMRTRLNIALRVHAVIPAPALEAAHRLVRRAPRHQGTLFGRGLGPATLRERTALSVALRVRRRADALRRLGCGEGRVAVGAVEGAGGGSGAEGVRVRGVDTF